MWATPMGPTDFDDNETAFERLSLDLPESDVTLLEQFAAYRNALAAAQGKKLRKRWTRKSVAEHFLKIQCEGLRHQLDEMTRELGPLPEVTKDLTPFDEYAARALEWMKRK